MLVFQLRFVRSLAWLVALSLVVSSACGCRDSSSGVPVNGSVSFKGTPIGNGTLTFFPTVGRPVPVSIVEGQYTIELAPGEYVAVVDVAAELPPGFKEGDPVPPPKIVLPEQYTTRAKSPLKATVDANQDAPINFDLK